MRRFLVPLFITGLILIPAVASAAWFPIVPCGVGGAAACTTCDLFKTFKNIIDLVLYGITGPIAAFMIVWAGGLMLLGGANPALYGQGTKMLQNTLIGVTIILLSWLATNTLIKTLAKGNDYDAWYEFSCPAFLQQPEAAALPAPQAPQGSAEQPAAALGQAAAKSCDRAVLSAAFHTPNNVKLNSSNLTALITCIRRDPIVTKMLDTRQLFTYENDNPLCNLTRGNRMCGSCAHKEFSCHYGGKTGTQGAEAVDFNWNGATVTYVKETRTVVTNPDPNATGGPCASVQGNPQPCRTVTGEQGLFDEIYRAATKNNCSFKLINFEPGGTGGHTHMSTTTCTSDGIGTKGRAAPIMP